MSIAAAMPTNAIHPLITGHRGFPLVAPENTIASFEAAIEAGADRLEMDVFPTIDGEVVIHHDYLLGRTNNGHGPIVDCDWPTLAQLDAGAWFSETFRGARLCRLDEVFARFGASISYEIELKWPVQTLVDAVIDRVERAELVEKVELTSSLGVIHPAVRARNGRIARGIFLSAYPGWMPRELGHCLSVESATLGQFAVAHFPPSILDTDLVSRLRARQILVHAADFNTIDDLERAYSLGVDRLSTNDVATAFELRARVAR